MTLSEKFPKLTIAAINLVIFNLESPKPRVGDIGDSVNYGVGTGDPFLASDYLETRFPFFEYWNFLRRVGSATSDEKLEELSKFRIEKAIYVVNLNDILPAYRIRRFCSCLRKQYSELDKDNSPL